MATNIIVSGTGTSIKVLPVEPKIVKIIPAIGSVPPNISVDSVVSGFVFANAGIQSNGTFRVLGSSIFEGQTTFGGDTIFSGPSTRVNNLHATSMYFGSASPNSGSTIGLSNFYPNQPSDLSITSNGNVTIYLDNDSNETGQKFRVMDPNTDERFSVDDDGYVKFNSQYTFPNTDGSSGQILKTDGGGNLYWVNESIYSPPPPASSITVDDIEAPVITSPEDIELRLDTDNTGNAQFFITNTAGTTLMSVDETGTVTFLKEPFPSTVKELEDTPVDYGTAGQVLAVNATADGTEWVTVSGELVSDTTPQLGGDLDVNGNSIVSSNNGDIIIHSDGTGRIGINTYAPQARLHVDGETIIGGEDETGPVKLKILGTGDRGGSIRAYADADGIAGLTFGLEGFSSGAFRFEGAVMPSPHLGQDIGSSGEPWRAVYTQRVQGRNNTSEGDLYLSSGTTSNEIQFQIAGTEKARLHNDGNFGIGTSSPTEKLHVVGSIKIDDGVNPFTLPSSDGTNGQVLQTDGAGNTAWVDVSSGGGELVSDTTPQLGGTLDTNTYDIAFQDNDMATFGAGGDLQIYHDGNDSFIKDVGAGDLKIRASTVKIEDADGSPTHMQISNSQLTLNSASGLINVGNNKIGNGVDEEYIKIDGINNLVSINVENIPYLTVGDNNSTGNGYVRVDGKLQIGTEYELPTTDGTSGQVLQTDGAGNAEWVSSSYPTSTISASTTLSSSHEQKMLLCNSATAMTLTINTGMSADTEILVYQAGTGGVTISAGTGVTINNTASFTEETAEQYAIIGLKKLGTSEVWVITGERKLA